MYRRVVIQAPARAKNLWIELLAPSSRSLLLKMCEPLTVSSRDVVHAAGAAAPLLYFPITAVFSMIVTMSDGKMIEAHMVGREGYVPVSSGLIPRLETVTTIVQIGGDALAIDAKTFADLAAEDLLLAGLRDRYLAAVFDVVMQSVGCNAVHSVRQRCSRWLLALADRTDSHDINIIHQVLAEALGASRPRVTEILATLQEGGLLELQRGTLRIVDLEGLQGAACECYAIMKRLLFSFSKRPQ